MTMRRRDFTVALAALAGGAGVQARSTELVDTQGRPFRLEGGTWTLLTFGFTRCSSTCPVSLAHAAQALSGMRAAPRFVFVTLDPLSDDPAALGAYLRRFDERIVGVTGDPRAIDQLATRFRVGVRGEGAQLQHSSVWYVVDPTLSVRRVLPSHASATELVAVRNS